MLLHIATALSIVSVLMLTFELIVVRGVDVISCMCVIRSLICVVVASWWHVASVLYSPIQAVNDGINHKSNIADGSLD